MNVIIANRNRIMLNDLNIEVMKKEEGEFDIDAIISNYKNIFFQRMILDITAIKNYKDIKNLQKLSVSLDMSKIILLLDESPELSTPLFLSQLISIGIYNFTKNLDGIMYLYQNPNTYRDVAYLHQLDQIISPQGAQMPQNNKVAAPIMQPNVVTQTVSRIPTRIIGIKNATKQSGATTLAYLMYKALSKCYDTTVVEVGKSDFKYFNDRNLNSVDADRISDFLIKNNNKEVIIVDVNDEPRALELCSESLYLFEPSIIKLNKLMAIKPDTLQKLKNKNVILNQSLLTNKDVSDFEYESGMKVYFNMPPLNERMESNIPLDAMLIKMGFDRIRR